MARSNLSFLPTRIFLLVFVATHLRRLQSEFAAAFGIGLRKRSIVAVSPENGAICGRWVPSQRTIHFHSGNELKVHTKPHFSILLASSPTNQEEHSSHDDKFDAFLDYMFREMDCQGEPGDVKVRIDEETGRRGIYVTAENGIAEGDYVFAVPMKSAWVVETVFPSSTKELSGEEVRLQYYNWRQVNPSGTKYDYRDWLWSQRPYKNTELSDAERGLRFWKWMQSNDDKIWKPYKEILPTRNEAFDPTPDFWSEEQIRALEVPQIVQGALERKKSVRALAKKVSREESVDLSEDDLRFATWLVCSRAITVIENEKDNDDDDDDDVRCYDDVATLCALVPLLDMINHSSEKPNVHFSILGDDGDENEGDVDDDENENLYYAVVADRDLRKGEELLLSYGSKKDSSADLLLQYGFIPETNPHDEDFWYWEVIDCQSKFRYHGSSNDFAWATNLQKDEDRLAAMSDDESRTIERTILEFRIRMKRAHQKALEIYWAKEGW